MEQFGEHQRIQSLEQLKSYGGRWEEMGGAGRIVFFESTLSGLVFGCITPMRT